MNIVIDNEFKNLIPPLTPDEFAGLKQSIMSEGCRDPLVLWGDILIDGHNRYDICTRNNTPFQTVQREFTDRNAAIEWIILNQFGRRNLPAHEHARLVLRLKDITAEKAKNRMLNPMQNSAQGTTRDILAKIAGVSHDTIAKVERIEKDAPAPVVQASRKGEISVNAAYQVTKLEPEQQVDDLEKSGKPTLLLICTHEVDDVNTDILAKDCIVKIAYYKGRVLKHRRITAKEIVDLFIRLIEKR